ncbi:autotransporter outer membrane beta-barrel domain-containing protein [Brucella pituitosa]|uniref:Autotransporter outer membrane beta-barrel domain-containing protein n=1 Tax=Brucella pituitosa TaxID=571256 RepID=A0ABS3K2W6_9HYPH|nr:autotransporter outer membrane beta-barrel domain-containing protein [Brucella pituitosa]MBO1041266.1 autotransporter outer membrane beta-barrel domain-containing protein [Brucella pituitosa]
MNSSLVNGAMAFGYVLSAEVGQRVAIDDHWSLMPQAQLMRMPSRHLGQPRTYVGRGQPDGTLRSCCRLPQ